MPSPAYIFRDLFTVLELQTMMKTLATTGRVSSLSGAAKSSSFENLPIAQILIEFRAELNRLQGTKRASKVQSRFEETGYTMGGTITTK